MSRLTGLARERALGYYLGTSAAADAFTAAFRIPNLLQHLLGEGVLSASFIPVHSRLLAAGREREAARVAGAIAGLLTAATGVLALLGILLAVPLTTLVAPGFRARPETFALTVELVRWLFPGVGFLVLAAWCLGVLNSHRRFFLSYVAPALLNVTQIAVLVGAGTALLGGGVTDTAAGDELRASLVTWLAVGTTAGGGLQFLVQLVAVRRTAGPIRPSLRTDLPGVRRTIRAFVPVVSARGVIQLTTYVHVLLGSFLAAGALATLRYAQILYTLPVSLFGMAVAAAELPALSAGEHDGTDAGERLRAGSARIAALVVPTVVGYLLLGDLITGALFRTGAFDASDTVAVWVVLGGYTLGLLASTSSRLLQSALYAAGDPRTPARVAVLRVVTSAAVGSLLMLQFDRVAVTAEGLRLLGDLPATAPLPDTVRAAEDAAVRLGAAGLSLAGGLAAWLEYTLLRRAVTRRVGRVRLAGGQLRPILTASLVAGAVGLAVRPLLAGWPPVIAGVLAVGATATAYVLAARLTGVDEVTTVVRALTRRLRRR